MCTTSLRHADSSLKPHTISETTELPAATLQTWVENQTTDSPAYRQRFGSLSVQETPCQNQIDLLDKSLSSHEEHPSIELEQGRQIAMRPGDHFLFWNDFSQESRSTDDESAPLETLQKDGYHGMQAPPDHLWKHRLWTAGSIIYHDTMSYTASATCIEHIQKIEMVDQESCKITTERKIVQHDVPKLTELRTLMYTNKTSQAAPRPGRQAIYGTLLHEFTPSSLLLFRYASLTSNAHRIHYDVDYAREEEHYPNLLAQGSLLVTMVLRTLVLGTTDLAGCQYRMLTPCYVGETLQIRGKQSGNVYDCRVFGKSCGDLKMTLRAQFV